MKTSLPWLLGIFAALTLFLFQPALADSPRLFRSVSHTIHDKKDGNKITALMNMETPGQPRVDRYQISQQGKRDIFVIPNGDRPYVEVDERQACKMAVNPTYSDDTGCLESSIPRQIFLPFKGNSGYSGETEVVKDDKNNIIFRMKQSKEVLTSVNLDNYQLGAGIIKETAAKPETTSGSLRFLETIKSSDDVTVYEQAIGYRQRANQDSDERDESVEQKIIGRTSWANTQGEGKTTPDLKPLEKGLENDDSKSRIATGVQHVWRIGKAEQSLDGYTEGKKTTFDHTKVISKNTVDLSAEKEYQTFVKNYEADREKNDKDEKDIDEYQSRDKAERLKVAGKVGDCVEEFDLKRLKEMSKLTELERKALGRLDEVGPQSRSKLWKSFIDKKGKDEEVELFVGDEFLSADKDQQLGVLIDFSIILSKRERGVANVKLYYRSSDKKEIEIGDVKFGIPELKKEEIKKLLSAAKAKPAAPNEIREIRRSTL